MNLENALSKDDDIQCGENLTGQSNSAQFMSTTDKPPKGMIGIDLSLWKELGRRRWTREKIGS
jgi:hypothetical protein